MSSSSQSIRFVDAFAGCGGLSLGLLQAGLRGVFAIERDENAFKTLKTNLLRNGAPYRFSWPRWLPKAAIAIDDLLLDYCDELERISGTVDLLVGGPPCQGFSSAGKRIYEDPRNHLFLSYLDLVWILRPRAVLIENVRGFTSDFERDGRIDNFSQKIRQELSLRYDVFEKMLDLSDFGVPQSRTRYFLLAVESGICEGDPFNLIEERIPTFLRTLGLVVPVSSKSALSDLEVDRVGTRESTETKGFREIKYDRPLSQYQKLMNDDAARLTDLRLARHSDEITDRFQKIIAASQAEGRLNTSISEDLRSKFGLKKRALRVLDPDRPAPTVTSMPDDLLHYSEPRALTVRENARLQSFPDWFEFKGKYTTGGHRRRAEVPRFTQVANAVPPLVANAIGEVLKEILTNRVPARSSKSKRSTLFSQRKQERSKLSAQVQ